MCPRRVPSAGRDAIVASTGPTIRSRPREPGRWTAPSPALSAQPDPHRPIGACNTGPHHPSQPVMGGKNAPSCAYFSAYQTAKARCDQLTFGCERSSVCSMMMLGFAASQSLIFASRVPNCACLLPDFTENIFSFTAHPSLGEAQTIRERRPCSAHNAGSGYPLCRICARPAQCERGAMIRESRVESPQA